MKLLKSSNKIIVMREREKGFACWGNDANARWRQQGKQDGERGREGGARRRRGGGMRFS